MPVLPGHDTSHKPDRIRVSELPHHPAIVLGNLSLIALVVTGAAIYLFHLKGRWHTTFVIGAMLSLYFNLFVLVVQMFRHMPLLTHLDPTQSGPPFGIAELALLTTFVWLTVSAAPFGK